MIKFLLFSFLIIAVIGIISCTEEGVNNPIGNQPPNTGLFLFPDSTILPQQSRQGYKVNSLRRLLRRGFNPYLEMDIESV